MKTALVVTSLLLVACSAPPPPAPVEPAAPTAPASTAAARATPLHSFRALGTEPFWHLDVDGDSFIYTTPENQAGLALAGTRSAIAGGVDIRGIHGGQPFVLRVRPGDCSDGMSDNRYPMTAELALGSELLKGCADGDE